MNTGTSKSENAAQRERADELKNIADQVQEADSQIKHGRIKNKIIRPNN
ncbi:unnamed protein product [Paramecium octaurelia]|uniref:Uncharacterized protein n=1 Tax=Paramecium octaurelia TaxID=43137 RepID=A0A8S1U4B7_PAROT|nr:unnamed protein product [Paramecium octaurelia]